MKNYKIKCHLHFILINLKLKSALNFGQLKSGEFVDDPKDKSKIKWLENWNSEKVIYLKFVILKKCEKGFHNCLEV